MANLSVDVPPWVFKVARIRPGTGVDGAPTWGGFKKETRLRLLDLMEQCSFVGQNYATIAAITGRPQSDQVDVENADAIILANGDRIMIGLDRGDSVDWQFCGYCVTESIHIHHNTETAQYKIVGPEFYWGSGNPNDGAFIIVDGQMRRTHIGDDSWLAQPSRVSLYSEWDFFGAEPTIFNPIGRKNMTDTDVILSNRPRVLGRIFDMPDRRILGSTRTQFWTVIDAVRYLFACYNDPGDTGIYPPDDFVPLLAEPIKDVNVNELPLWEAIRRVCGAKYGFFVSPKSERPGQWGPFRVSFHSRTEGPAANFVLNERGTPMIHAIASVARIEAARDVSNSVTKIVTKGQQLRHIKLIYWGGATPNLTTKQKKTSLQHGWQSGDNIADYTGLSGKIEWSDLESLNDATRKKWRDRFVTSGALFPKYENVFRCFTWNETAEMTKLMSVKYGTAAVSHPFYPDLVGIVDGLTPQFVGKYYRRARKLHDTLYLRRSTDDEWNKIQPSLFIARADDETDIAFADWKWFRVAHSDFRIDQERAAIYITRKDLALWRPFAAGDGEAYLDTDPNTDAGDFVTFATMLADGTLRLIAEASIELDQPMIGKASRNPLSGSPFVQERIIDATKRFAKTLDYNDGYSSQTGLTPILVDDIAAATEYSEMIRRGAEDEKIHASILTSGDWEKQQMGSVIFQITGRTINLTSAGGRGAQIVAIRTDPNSLKLEYLTASVALELNARDRRILGSTRVYRGRSGKIQN